MEQVPNVYQNNTKQDLHIQTRPTPSNDEMVKKIWHGLNDKNIFPANDKNVSKYRSLTIRMDIIAPTSNRTFAYT